MNSENADKAIIISALVVAIVYGYRRLDEATTPGVSLPRLIGVGNPVPFAAWATAWGTLYFMLAIAGSFAPSVAGGFSVLVAVSDVLANGQQLFGDLSKQTTPTAPKSPPAPKKG